VRWRTCVVPCSCRPTAPPPTTPSRRWSGCARRPGERTFAPDVGARRASRMRGCVGAKSYHPRLRGPIGVLDDESQVLDALRLLEGARPSAAAVPLDPREGPPGTFRAGLEPGIAHQCRHDLCFGAVVVEVDQVLVDVVVEEDVDLLHPLRAQPGQLDPRLWVVCCRLRHPHIGAAVGTRVSASYLLGTEGSGRRRSAETDPRAVQGLLPVAPLLGELLRLGQLAAHHGHGPGLDRTALMDAEVGIGVQGDHGVPCRLRLPRQDRKSTRLNSSHVSISYAVFCLKKKTTNMV